jgi:holo-[acyl-carrier protein] synthase
MIYGIGTDIVLIKRIEGVIRLNDKFAIKILGSDELDIYNKQIKNKAKFLAKRFAAKEAFAKACGTGVRDPILLKSIQIINNDLGKPKFYLSNGIILWLKQHNINNHHLSITDEVDYAVAFVILEH